PQTRASWRCPRRWRSASAVDRRRPANSSRRPLPARARPPPAGPGAAAASSTMVFHSPQLSQRPLHLFVTAPPDWQTKRLSGRAMSVHGWRQGALGEAPVVAMQPARVVLVVPVATQARGGLLAGRVGKRPGQGGVALGGG